MSNEVHWPDRLFDDIDRNGPIPLYFQVSSRLEAAIRSGEIPQGARLENEIAIGERLGLSRPTIRRAIQELVDRGLLVRRRGIGTQVVQGQVTRQVELTSLFDDLQQTHHTPGTSVLEHEVIPAPANVAEHLGLAEGADVLHIRRLRTADDSPVAILQNYFPADVTDLTREELQERGLYQILRARGVTIRVANQRIGARRAHDDEGRLLEIDRDGPVLLMERTAFDNAGRAIEYGLHIYRPDRYSFETTLVAK
ncbi:GntR family transcriptional regulator [Microbacterium sp. lyk4-40-TSB-66]|uniref:GntR family transcriptional regulator n=1 Tax=Microbacterium sp. lyk4-40-TSB-66 TaxID=3040294 RepID=UPI00254C8A18|nr:GntR family transcriptional regulator [Microbacterium sp. lyk4-40-TSB-66]